MVDFIIGLIVGNAIGATFIALLSANKDSEREDDN